MFDLATLALFAASCIALTISPGPDMLLIASRSVAQGRLAGLSTLLGIQAGTYVHAIAAALGLSSLIIAFPVAYDFIRYAGVAYLFFLAYQALTAKADMWNIDEETPHHTNWKMFKQGLMTNILNPKMIIFVLAFFPQFTNPEAGSILVQFLILATIINLIGLIVNGAVILSACGLGKMFSRHPGMQRLQSWFLASVFCALGLKLLLDDRK